jgi:hypothetical protein
LTGFLLFEKLKPEDIIWMKLNTQGDSYQGKEYIIIHALLLIQIRNLQENGRRIHHDQTTQCSYLDNQIWEAVPAHTGVARQRIQHS